MIQSSDFTIRIGISVGLGMLRSELEQEEGCLIVSSCFVAESHFLYVIQLFISS